ncbi:MAG: ATP-binding protein [Elusimicrobiota bacterium]
MPQPNAQTLERLIEIGRLLSSKLELGELLTSVLELLTRVVDCESASLLLLDEQTQELYFDVALGLGADASKVRLKLGQGIAGTAAKNRKAEIINNVRADPRWSAAMDAESGFTTQSLLAMPMILKGRVIGVLEAINKRDGAFDDNDLHALESFAGQAAIAIENARLFSSLKEERVKLATVFSQMSNAVALTEDSGKILLANESAKSLFGPDVKDISAALRPFETAPPLAKLLAEECAACDFAAIRKEPTLLALEGRVTRVPLSGHEGRLFIFHDRTEKWRREKLKRTFLSLISHKLRTPLSTVTGFADILLEELDPEKSSLAVKAARTIREQGTKLCELVDKLLSYTTIESPDIRIDPRRIDVGDAIQSSLQALKKTLDARNAQVNVAKTDAVIMGDKTMIVEAIKNLVDNAVKFNTAQRPRVDIQASTQDGWTTISVSDDGPGVPPEDLERVFSGFHQIEKDFTGQQEGMGLGLAYVKKTASLHGGSALMRSELGKGARVTLTLPKGTLS